MKKIFFSLIVFLTVFIIGCKTGGGDPKSVLMNFIEALDKKDINTAKKYATKESDSMLGMMQMTMSMVPDSAKGKIFDKNNMEFGDAVIDGDKATIPVKNKKTGESTNYTLKKEGSDWKVAFDKAGMMDMGKDKMKGMNSGDMKSGMDSASKMLNNMNQMDTTNLMQDTSH